MTDIEKNLRSDYKKSAVTDHNEKKTYLAAQAMHDIANLVNNINISANIIVEKFADSEVKNFKKITQLMNDNSHDLDRFLTENPKGKNIPLYLIEACKTLSDEQEEFIQKLNYLIKNIQHIKDIVRSQQHPAKTSGANIKANLREIIEDTVQLNSARIEKNNITIVTDIDELTTVSLDRSKLMRIFINLIDNAIDALSDNKNEKIIKITASMQNNKQIRIEVTDNGCGMSEQYLTDAFSQGFTTKGSGRGIGLYYCAIAAKEMKGSITAKSPGMQKGTTFTIEMPYERIRGKICPAQLIEY